MLAMLAFLCPPLAVALTGSPAAVVKNLALTCLGFVPGVLHARETVEQFRINRRYATLMRLLDAPAVARAAQVQAA